MYTATNDKKYRINRNITHLYPFYNKKQALACFFNSFKENGQEGSSVQGDEEKHPPVRPVSQQAEQRKGVDASGTNARESFLNLPTGTWLK